MALTIDPNVAAAAAQGTVGVNMPQLNQALSGRASTTGAQLQASVEADSAEFSTHTEAVAIAAPVTTPDAASELAQQTHTHIAANPDGAIAAQGGADPRSVFALLG